MAVDLIKKSFKYWEAVKFTEVDTSFPKFVFLLESSNFIFGNKYCQLLSLMLTAFVFKVYSRFKMREDS